MTTSYYPQENDWYDGDWAYEEAYDDDAADRGFVQVDIVALAAVLLVVLLLVGALSRVSFSSPALPAAPEQNQEEEVKEPPPLHPAPVLPAPGAETFVLPYTSYILTQGPHGMSYGHYAIDLAAGKGEPVLSPINGRVSQLYTDGIGNPTLVIENENYTVTMLHGLYDVTRGQEVQAGDQVGVESNQGNTRDMNGQSCRNRACGYHTHLNVYDKRAGQNVNPLDLLPKPYAS
jgi:murein DD-endopeptidase MepM/ murein hydrolase activator NlpD